MQSHPGLIRQAIFPPYFASVKDRKCFIGLYFMQIKTVIA